jgi:ferredoxin
VSDNPALDGGFEVRLDRSGRTVHVPAGETILDILLDAGINVSFSCTEGHCGTCETRVVDGIPDHRDSFLSDEERAENGKIMICCSRSRSPLLVLDL